MPTVREEIREVLREFNRLPEPDLIAAQLYSKMALKAYADALRLSPYRSRSHNERAIEVAYEFAEKAIQFGASEERLEGFLLNLRRRWVPTLPEGDHP